MALWQGTKPRSVRYAVCWTITPLPAWADQGMLLWALQRTGQTEYVRSELSWNHPSGEVAHLISGAALNGRSILDQIRAQFPTARIVHWLGAYKLSQQLTSELEELFIRGVGDCSTPQGCSVTAPESV